MNKSHIADKIRSKESIIGVIGLGYIGIPLAMRFIDESFKVYGFEINHNKVDKLKSGKSYINNISSSKISSAIKNGFCPSTSFENINKTDVIIICVPTPLKPNKDPDLSYIHGTLDLIKPFLKENQTLILESTTYPGTTEELIVPLIQSMGFKIGNNFFIMIGYIIALKTPNITYYI